MDEKASFYCALSEILRVLIDEYLIVFHFLMTFSLLKIVRLLLQCFESSAEASFKKKILDTFSKIFLHILKPHSKGSWKIEASVSCDS